MKKLFYTDPLAAAYMAREFGVIYGIKMNTGEFNWNPAYMNPYYLNEHLGCNIRDYCADEECIRPLYIHPDRYHIFEPLVGDVIEYEYPWGKGTKLFYTDVEKVNKKEKLYTYVLGDYKSEFTYEEELPKIIQRNNKQFFMPEEASD